MIEDLRIRNLGVIESAEVSFGDGMWAITGETGAGKTMALTSLALLMGGRADAALVRNGAKRATVEGTFVVEENSPVVQIVQDAGGDVDIESGRAAVVIARQVPASGRSRAFAGGRSVPIAVLQQIAQYVVTVHGQSDQYAMRGETQQRKALDEFGGPTVLAKYGAYRERWAARAKAAAELEEFSAGMRQMAAQRLALEAMVKQVDAVAPELGEDEKLKAEADLLDNVEDLREALALVSGALDGSEAESGATSRIGDAAATLRKITGRAPDLAELAEQLEQVESVVGEISSQVGERLAGLQADPHRLNQIHERRAELRELERALGMPVPEILEQRENADEKLAALQSPDEHRERLQERLAEADRELSAAAKELTGARAKAGAELGKRVSSELHNLAMKGATFSVQMEPLDQLGPHGAETVRFLLQAHPEAQSLPLSSSASGGEMSRIMLALEVTLNASPRPDHTFIFDEVDAGIGGKTALRVGERLARVAQASQVLTVTHLPQVAAYASHHVVVEKGKEDGETKTNVREVAGEERLAELARMLSGHADSPTARTHAAELINGAIVR